VADRLSALAEELRRRTGRFPARLEELRTAGLWHGTLTDAEGLAFGYDESSGNVSISPESPLWRPR